MNLTEVIVAVAIAVGIVGIIVPILPGSLLIVGAVLVWAIQTGGTTAWAVFAAVTVLIAAGTIIKFLIPGRQLKDSGVPSTTLWIGAALGIVGFFVIPVVGIFAGFVLGVFLAEYRRVGSENAWPSTVAALKAVGISILIELAAAVLAALAWVIGVVVT